MAHSESSWLPRSPAGVGSNRAKPTPGKYTSTRLSTNGPSGFTKVTPAGSDVMDVAVGSAPDHKGASLIVRNHCGSPRRGLNASD